MATTNTVKLFSINMVAPGDMVSEKSTGPYRKVTHVERFGDIRRIWLEPTDDGSPDYLTGVTGDSLWQPHAPAEFDPADEARAARETETMLEEAAAGFGRPAAEADAGELAHLRRLGLA